MALDLAALRRLPPWALYGGAGVAGGGGYLLYRRRRAASSAAPVATQAAPVQSALDIGAQTQQSSIVPYYLTDQSASSNGTNALPAIGVPKKRPPKVTPAAIPSAIGATTTTLPDIPPLMPVAPTAPPPPPSAAPAAPAQTANNNLPADLLAKIKANGEEIVDALAAPNGGMWYLSSKGGVFGINAPYYGGALGQPYFSGRSAKKLVPNGGGYSIVDATGSLYNYGG